ncbi:hypothetical protein ACGF0D_38785 [Kitasatospora sp. NPDC048298]|uniref:hypothetical protein n=1 Tax=Kitasatospora sp. NPDC048298 TaxID=3364049 RepID=UPI0037150E74
MRRRVDTIALAALPLALAVILIAAVPTTAPTDLDRWLDLAFDQIHIVFGLATAGAFNQFWLMPRIAKARAADDTTSLLHLTLHHFPKVVWGEVVLGAAVLAVVPFIAGSARS